MSDIALPDGLFGNWIWSEPETQPYRESHVFFRRKFTLNEVPGIAEMWISCHTYFNIYINEQHLSFGPCPSIRTHSYVQYFNITHLLQTGKNIISIQASNPQISRLSNTKQSDGLWVQVNIDDTSHFATDDTWTTAKAQHMLPNQFRISTSHGFVETQDLRNYNRQWNKIFETKDSADLTIKSPHEWSEAYIISAVSPHELLP
ncbi:MAG: hypothetical protein MK132_01745 [Lentisphaerales bacterium]|nr:hypothetical protein [Lentisphaerales bacterium]